MPLGGVPLATAGASAVKGASFSSVLGSIGKVVGLGGAVKNLFGGGDHDQSWKQRLQFLVRDAKAAGIHPLAALGASANYSPNMATSGSAYGDGLRQIGADLEGISAEASTRSELARRDSLAQQELSLRVRQLEAQETRDEAAAQYYRSMAAKNIQDMYAQARDAGVGYRVVPNEVPASVAGNPGIQAGVGPAIQELAMPSGGTIRAGGGSPLQNPEGLTYYVLARDWWNSVALPELKRRWDENQANRAAERAKSPPKWYEARYWSK